MQNLFFVSVVIGIFSGTTLTAKAQPSVNMEQMSVPAKTNKSVKFIEGIEMKAVPAVADQTVVVKQVTTSSAGAPVIETGVAAIENCSAIQFKYAILLDMDVESLSNKVLFEAIENWWGTRYKYGGANRKGIDCSAYTCTLLHDIYNVLIPRTSREQYSECEKVDKEDLQQGDLVFFSTRRGRTVSHVGLYLGNGYFTHASTSSGVTISSLEDPYWNSKYVSGGRISATNQDQ